MSSVSAPRATSRAGTSNARASIGTTTTGHRGTAGTARSSSSHTAAVLTAPAFWSQTSLMPPPPLPLPAKKASKKIKKVITPPPPASSSSNNFYVKVDKHVVDELLLVCGVIGTSVEQSADQHNDDNNDSHERIVPVTDCTQWLQDLQRTLRRDEDLQRPISLLVGQWRVVPQKLVPLLVSCRYDNTLVLTLCKILVLLTKPLADLTVRAGKIVVDTKKHSPAVIQEQLKLRENAIQQAQQLVDYQRVLGQHPAVLSVLVSLLADPLSKTTTRTEHDHLVLELVLHLLRNLLAAAPLHVTAASREAHAELIGKFHSELVLDILLVLGANVEHRDNQQYNLLLMELLQHLLTCDPALLAQCGADSRPAGSAAILSHPTLRASQGLLSQQLRREQAQRQHALPARHGNFGGTLVQKSSATTTTSSAPGAAVQHNMSTAAWMQQQNGVNKPASSSTTVARRRNKQALTKISTEPSLQFATLGPAQRKALPVLHDFCTRFLAECYGPVMKSLKNEFRRDSVRLEDGDRVVFFKLAWFFTKWWRLTYETKRRTSRAEALEESRDTGSIGPLIFTMDIFTFNLVLNAIDHFLLHKKWNELATAVALVSEMMHLLLIMYQSDSTEHIMALGLMDRLFYGSEPLDRLPKMLSKTDIGVSTVTYLQDLVELCHIQLKLLELNAKACSPLAVTDGKSKKKKNVPHDTVAKMKASAADFDVPHYMLRKIVSNHTVQVYTQLLTQYATNPATVNHRIVSFFLRVSQLVIHKAPVYSSTDVDDGPRNWLAPTHDATMQPILYHVSLLAVTNDILNDTSIRADPNYDSLLRWCTQHVHDFAMAAQANRVLFVEAFFSHPLPHRAAEAMQYLYVSEELRMLAERDVLLEEQDRVTRQFEAMRNGGADDDSDSDDELEFDDQDETPPPTSTGNEASSARKTTTTSTAAARNKRKAIDDDSSSSDDDDSDDDDGNEDTHAAKLAKLKAEIAQLDAEMGELTEDNDDMIANNGDEQVASAGASMDDAGAASASPSEPAATEDEASAIKNDESSASEKENTTPGSANETAATKSCSLPGSPLEDAAAADPMASDSDEDEMQFE